MKCTSVSVSNGQDMRTALTLAGSPETVRLLIAFLVDVSLWALGRKGRCRLMVQAIARCRGSSRRIISPVTCIDSGTLEVFGGMNWRG